MGRHLITLYTPTGEFIDYLRFKSIDVTLAERDMGMLTLGIFPEYSDAIFQRDCRIAYQRSPEDLDNAPMRLVGDTVWLLASRERVLDQDGQHTIVLVCQHPNALLGRRVVAYDEGTTQADKSDVASDVCYDYVDENFVSATSTARNLSTAHFVLDPRPAPTFGPSAPISGSYRNVLELLQDITSSAASQDVYMGFEVYVQQPPGPFHVRFYNHQRGTDRGLTSGQTRLVDFSTMGQARVVEDWGAVVTFAYAGGSGNQDERLLQAAEDTDLSGQSPFGRVEYFESFNTDDTTVLSTEAEHLLRQYRPSRTFEGTTSPASLQFATGQYDIDYTWGDIIAAQFQAPIYWSGEISSWILYQFDCRVNPVHIRVVQRYNEYLGGIGIDETIDITLQSVNSTS